ncbi:MAG: DUF3237 family protein [Rubrivivax sp.]|nr:DUF3237 family protein [Rubrivivax sp.]
MNTGGSTPQPPALTLMARIDVEVGALVTLGAGPHGERRYVPLGGGTVSGPELKATVVARRCRLAGPARRRYARYPGALYHPHARRCAHRGRRVWACATAHRRSWQRLARGEAVAPEAYYFRTVMRF